jgi:poly(hydroxyalkanoate) depolymerase family esterase
VNPSLQRLLASATRMTHSGQLQQATAAIQEALAARFGLPAAGSAALAAATAEAAAAAATAGAAVRADDANVVDVEARVLDVDAPVAATPFAPASFAPRPSPAAAPAPAAARASASTPAGAAAGESFTGGSYVSSAGRLDYKLYLPPRPAAGFSAPLPLVVMLHGCTQTPDDFAAGTRMNEAAREQGFAVLYPAQAQGANPQRCWNWFKHNHQQRDRGEPALLAGMAHDVIARYAIDPQRVFVAGLSAGGAMAAILGQAYPERFAAVGVHSGLPTGVARDLPSALAAMKGGAPASPAQGAGNAHAGPPTIVFHGDADAVVHPVNGERAASASVGRAAPAAERLPQRQPGRREATRSVHRDASGRVRAEHWLVHGAGHAWSGGSANGSYTDASGPDATREMLRFFFEQRPR